MKQYWHPGHSVVRYFFLAGFLAASFFAAGFFAVAIRNHLISCMMVLHLFIDAAVLGAHRGWKSQTKTLGNIEPSFVFFKPGPPFRARLRFSLARAATVAETMTMIRQA